MFAKMAVLGGMCCASVGLASDVSAVTTFEVPKYLGKWYEIATIPQIFQTGCTQTTATYAANPDGTLSVQNECRLFFSGGPKVSISGVATAPDVNQLSKLKVSFFGRPGADYWVLSVDSDYRFALVGDPLRKTLWVLSRTPQMDVPTYEMLVGVAREQGFAVDKLRMTTQEIAIGQ